MKKDYTKVWAFEDRDSGLVYPPDTCPIFSSRGEAREEKKRKRINSGDLWLSTVLVLLTFATSARL